MRKPDISTTNLANQGQGTIARPKIVNDHGHLVEFVGVNIS